jgi:hypothetical protein
MQARRITKPQGAKVFALSKFHPARRTKGPLQEVLALSALVKKDSACDF